MIIKMRIFDLSSIRYLLKNISVYGLSTLMNSSVRFAVLAIGARVLGAGGYGVLDTIMFAGLVFASLITMGSDSSIIRLAFDEKYKKNNLHRLLSTSIFINVILCLIFIFIFWVSKDLIKYQEIPLAIDQLLVVVFIFAIGFSLISTNSCFLRAQFQHKRYLTATFITAAIRVVFVIPFLFYADTHIFLFLISLAVSYLICGFFYLYVNRGHLSVNAVETKVAFEILRYGAPVTVAVLILNLSPLVERLIILEFFDAKWLTNYAASAFPALLLGITIQVLNTAWVPMALKAIKENDNIFLAYSTYILYSAFIMLYLVLLISCDVIINIFIPINIQNPGQFFPFIGFIVLTRFSSIFTSFGFVVGKRTDIRMLTQVITFTLATLIAFNSVDGDIKLMPVIFSCVYLIGSIVELVISKKLVPNLKIPSKVITINNLIIFALIYYQFYYI